ncbi:MAG: glycoside:cation symporter, partial [Lachnospiraceae bacterium]|nr:glycoside:cation symporter [Lachnospiraceae bacterium]
GALFALVDQVIGALATIFVGGMVALSGFTDMLPQVEDKLTDELAGITIFMYCIVPMIGWIFSLFVMHHYELDKEKMQEINRKKSKKEEG